MKIKPLLINKICAIYGDNLTAQRKCLDKKRYDRLNTIMYDFNKIISDVNDKGTIDGKIFFDKDSEDWKRLNKLTK